MSRHNRMSLGANSILTPPQTSHRLLLGIELQPGLAIESIGTTASNTLLVTGEREHRQRHRDGHIHANLAGLDVLLEAGGSRSGAGEDGSSVSVLVLVDELDGIV